MIRPLQLLVPAIFAFGLLATQPTALSADDSSWPFQLLPKPDNYSPAPEAQSPGPVFPAPPPPPMPAPPRTVTPPVDARAPITNDPSALQRLYVFANGRRLALMRSRRVEIFDAASKQFLGNVAVNYAARALAFPTATQMIFNGGSGGLSEWSLPDFKLTRGTIIPDRPAGPDAKDMNSFDAAGDRLAIIGSKELGLYDVSNHRWLWKESYTITMGTPWVVMSPDGQWVAANFGAGKAGIYSAESGKLALTITGFPRDIAVLAFSPDGHTVATATQTHGVQLWDLTTGQMLSEIKYEIQRTAGSLVFSPDGRSLAVLAPPADPKNKPNERRVGVFALPDGKLQLEFTATGENVKGSASLVAGFSPDGHLLYTFGTDLENWTVD